MAELFRIETDRVTLILSGPLPEHAKGPTGALRIWPQRRDLTLRPGTARAGVSDAVARDPAETAGPPLHEETAYDLWLSSYHGERVELSHRDPALLTHLHAAPGRAQAYGHINFGGQVGLSRFSVRVDGEPELDLEVEVFPTKMAYRADYVAMREEVHAFAAGLALEYLRATHYGSATARHRPSGRLEWLALLRHLVGQLEQALHHVAQHPVRSLQRRDRPVRAEAVRRPDNRVRRALRTGRGQGGWAGQVQGGLPARQRVPEQRPVPSLDTPEHRWLAQQLRRIRQQLAQIVQDERHRQRQGHHAGSGGAQRDCQALAELGALTSCRCSTTWGRSRRWRHRSSTATVVAGSASPPTVGLPGSPSSAPATLPSSSWSLPRNGPCTRRFGRGAPISSSGPCRRGIPPPRAGALGSPSTSRDAGRTTSTASALRWWGPTAAGGSCPVRLRQKH